MRPSTRMVVLGGRRLWTPAALGLSLALWLDAADASTIMLNGSYVVRWGDKSDNNQHVSQVTALAQPKYNATGLNNLPALEYSSTQCLVGTLPSLANQRNIAFFGVSQIKSRVYGVGLGSGFPTNPTPGIRWGLFGNGVNTPDGIGWAGTSSNIFLGNGLLVPGSVAFQSAYVKSPTEWSVFQNGSTLVASVADTSFPVGTFNLFVGAESVSSVVSYGSIALFGEFVITIGVLSTTDRQRLEGYLAHKWKLTANLPSNHPFIFTPPLIQN